MFDVTVRPFYPAALHRFAAIADSINRGQPIEHVLVFWQPLTRPPVVAD